MKGALEVTRAENFSKWYQAVIKAADLAEASPVRGCMVIKPWGYGIWELIQQGLDRHLKATGHENCYFPLFIPMSFIAAEAEHVEGFAKEMAVVTHHRLKMTDGKLAPDPEAILAEPLIVRPTSETIFGDSFKRWIQSYRDLPLLLNQWANVVRWEMRTRLFLRTTEFLWQEGHTAHATADEAFQETLRVLEIYRSFAEGDLAMPVVAGEKPANERFPGAQNTFSIEAMMQDGKALQAGTSHYLGTNFAKAQGITFQSREGKALHVHTTSWGASTRLIGGLIMTHGDDDGLRLPPKVAPRQVVIIPLTKGGADDDKIEEFCAKLAADLFLQQAFGSQVRVLTDTKEIRPQDKRWNWIKRGAPIIVEVGLREVNAETVTYIRRDKLRGEGKIASQTMQADDFLAGFPALLSEIQDNLYMQARVRLESNIRKDLTTFEEVADYFGTVETEQEEDAGPFKGWARVPWSAPTGAALDAAVERLKRFKLTIRNIPFDERDLLGRCIFTGEPGAQHILIARAY